MMQRLFIFALAAVAAVGVYLFLDTDEAVSPSSGGDAAHGKAVRGPRSARLGVRRVKSRLGARTHETKLTEERIKPDLTELVDRLEDEKISKLERELIEQLQRALDANDFGLVSQIAGILQRESAAAVAAAAGRGASQTELSPILKKKVIEALGWFGAKAVPELVGFLGETNEEVVQDVQTQLELALQDIDLSDREISDIVVRLASIVNDPEALDSYFIELSRMRNSVMIDTLVEISDTGTDAAKEKVGENLEFYTGDPTVQTVADAERWKAENPDGEGDEAFYGGQMPTDDTEMVSVKVDIEKYLAAQEKAAQEFEKFFAEQRAQQAAEEAARQAAAQDGEPQTM